MLKRKHGKMGGVPGLMSSVGSLAGNSLAGSSGLGGLIQGAASTNPFLNMLMGQNGQQGAPAPTVDVASAGPQQGPQLPPPVTADQAAQMASAVPPQTPHGMNSDIESYIRQSAKANGVDPDTAVKVWQHEGGQFDPSKPDRGGDGGSSFGPFQLHYGGINPQMPHAGMGDDFTKATGLDAKDPSTWKQQVDFAMQGASKNGWGAWMGAKAAGLGNWDGIGGRPPGGGGGTQMGTQPHPASPGGNGPLARLIAGMNPSSLGGSPQAGAPAKPATAMERVGATLGRMRGGTQGQAGMQAPAVQPSQAVDLGAQDVAAASNAAMQRVLGANTSAQQRKAALEARVKQKRVGQA